MYLSWEPQANAPLISTFYRLNAATVHKFRKKVNQFRHQRKPTKKEHLCSDQGQLICSPNELLSQSWKNFTAQGEIIFFEMHGAMHKGKVKSGCQWWFADCLYYALMSLLSWELFTIIIISLPLLGKQRLWSKQIPFTVAVGKSHCHNIWCKWGCMLIPKLG